MSLGFGSDSLIGSDRAWGSLQVTLKSNLGNEFKLNGKKLKHYLGGSLNEVQS